MGRTQNRRRVRYPVLNLQAAGSAMATTGRRCRLEALERRFVLSGAPASEAGGWFAQLQAESVLGTTADRWIVRLTDEALGSAATVSEAATRLTSADFPLQVVRGLGLPGQLLVESSGLGTLQVAAWLAANPAVAYFQADSLLSAQAAPNDPLYGGQIGLHNTGQTGGTSGADIDAEAAWNITTGSSSVVVAVIDSGVDLTHPDLAANFWTNPAEIAGNGLDDDGNDLIDDVQGYDFVHDASSPVDDNGHGTHVAGTIAAVGDNGVGVAGVSWHASLMVLKYLDNNLQGQTANAVLAVNYVTYQRLHNNVNVRVINASWGDPNANPALQDAIEQAGAADILVVAAAGNGDALSHGLNLDQGNAFYPASYPMSNIISVGASTPDDTLAGFSNYGPTSVDIVAPGVGILSTLPGGLYGTLNGTSMAAPHVSGVAALVFAYKPDASAQEVRNAILQGADQLPSLTGKVATSGRLNAYRALTAESFAPTGQMTPLLDITVPTAASQTITVTYSGQVPLEPATIADSNLHVTRVGFANTSLQVTKKTVTQTTPNEIVVTYSLPALGGGWDAIDNGTYQVVLQGGEVRDTNGLASRTSVLGTFAVSIYDPSVLFVNTTDDLATGTISHGLVTDTLATSSLRAAIIAANSLPGPHTIVLPDATYTLTIAGASEDAAVTGDLDILGSVSILGGGASLATISADGIDRVFDVYFDATLSLHGLTIRNGSAVGGGGINNFGTLNIRLSTITDNTAVDGGGIFNVGTLLLAESTLSSNLISSPISGAGGGLWNSGTAKIDRSLVLGNSAVDGGGGVVNQGTLEAFNSTFSGNSATSGKGGAIYSNGTLNVLGCTIVDNHADASSAGGIYNEAQSLEFQNQGSFGGNGLSDSAGSISRVAVQTSGDIVYPTKTIFAIDAAHKRIQVFDSDGVFKFTFGHTFANGGYLSPSRIKLGMFGKLYVLDSENHGVQVFDTLGNFQFAFGDAQIGQNVFAGVNDIAADYSHIYALNSQQREVYVFDLTGVYQSTFSTITQQNGPFGYANATIVADYGNRVYVHDGDGGPIKVFNDQGEPVFEYPGPFFNPVVSPEMGGGTVSVYDSGRLNTYLGSNGNLIQSQNIELGNVVGDAGNYRLLYTFESRRINTYTTNGDVTLASTTKPLGHEDNDFARAIATDGAGRVYVADTFNNRIQVFENSVLVHQFGAGGTGLGYLYSPEGIAVDAAGKIYVVDSGNNRVQVFDNSGVSYLSFGTAGSGPGQFNHPMGIAVNSAGNIVVADRDNNRVQVFNAAGNFLFAFGEGDFGDLGSTYTPKGVALDAAGNIYVTEGSNDLGGHRIEVFDQSGVYLRAFTSGQVPGYNFGNVDGIAIRDGNIYVTDSLDHRVMVLNTNFEPKAIIDFNDQLIGVALNSKGDVFVSGKHLDGIQQYSISRATYIANTVIAGNSAANDPDVAGAFQSRGHNFIGVGAFSPNGFAIDFADVVGTAQSPIDPHLSPLQDNGGATLSYLPLIGSPLIDSGDNQYSPSLNLTGQGVDQIGHVRPQNLTGSPLATIDRGAVERTDGIIRGRLFQDTNGNHVLDSNEPGLAGSVIYLDMNSNDRLDPGEPNTIAVVDDPETPLIVETGNYSFTVPAGNYRISFVSPTGFRGSAPQGVVTTNSTIDVVESLDSRDAVASLAGDSLTSVYAPALSQGKLAFIATRPSGEAVLLRGYPNSGIGIRNVLRRS